MNKILCHNLYVLRKKINFTQVELINDIALKTNYILTRQRYQAIEVGVNEPNLEFIIRIADYYQLTLDELILQKQH